MNDVTICNLALGHLGDIANVKSINPPDQSVQAQLCKRFYPAARNALLEMSSWGFATVRAKLAQVGNPTPLRTAMRNVRNGSIAAGQLWVEKADA